MKAKMKPHKLLSMLLALVMVVGLLPTVAYAETSTVYITKIEINDFNPEFHTGMTGTAAKNSLTFSYPDDANYSKGNNNVYIKQNGSYIYGNNLTAGEATLIIPAYANPFGNNEENPAYDFDKDHLNSIEVWINGEKRTDVEVKGYNSAWRKVDIYIPVTVSEYTGLTHTVTFDSNGGTAVESQQVVNSGYASEPSKPTKDGKVFIGWYTDPELTTKFNFSSIPITSDITLYAKWEDKVVTQYITKIEINDFNPEFHTGMTGTAAKNSLTFSYPDDANYSKDNDNIFIKQNGSYIYGNNLTAGEATLIIPAYANPFGNNEENPAYDFDKDNLNSIEVWINGEKRTDVEVKGYNSAWRKVEIYIPVTVSEYTGLKHTVSFAANGGTGTMADVTGISGEYTLPANDFTAPDGKHFKCWSVDGVEKAVGDTITVNANTTVTAIWEAIEYNVTVTGGTASVSAGTPITKATMGTTVTLTAGAAPSGQIFDKWVVEDGSASITLADANSATTTFTMPAGEVSVKATYKNAPHTHTYNQETVKPEALKTPADCTSNAVYFKSCSCGAISTTDTFVAMNTALGHAYGSDWKYDSTNHWHECSRCHDKKYEAAHDYGSDNVCDTCGYDKTVPHTHNLTLVPAKAATCTNPGNTAYYTCDGCDKWFEDATGSVEITDKTSVKIPAPGHTAGTEWKSDDTNHWHECTVAGCGVIIESTKSAHTAGEWIVDTPATATTAGTKHKECTVCHRVLETQPIPSTGTELKIIAGDNQIYNKASGSDVTITCNGDFAKFTGIKVDGSVVDSSNYTAVSGSTVLTLKASYLGTLTDGSHTITFVYTDGEANANLTVRTAGSGHIHDYGTEWKSNADNHWHECNCGDKKDEAAHSFKWVVDKEATATKKGSKHEECKICGYKRSAVEIPATGTSTAPTDTTKPNDTTKPGNTNGSEKSPQTGDNSMMWLWIALLFVSGFGVVTTTVYTKKRKSVK